MSVTRPGGGERRSDGRAWRHVLVVALVAVVAGCGGADVPEEVGTPAASSVPATTGSSDDTAAPADDTAAPADGDEGAPTAAPSPTTASPSHAPSSDATMLPGVPYDHPYIDAGDVLGVIGVAHDDVLNVRAGPATDFPVVTTLEPTAYGLLSTGRSREVDGRFWHEVAVGDVTGWASGRYLSFIGPTFDDTSRVVASLGHVRAETMTALGREVSSFYVPVEPEVEPRVVMTVAPEVGDLGEVTYDVVGILDDAGAGYRLHVIAQPDDPGGGFTLRTVEVTDLCLRGGTPAGSCP